MHVLLSWSPWQKRITTAVAGCLLLVAAVAITTARMQRRPDISESGRPALELLPMWNLPRRDAARGVVGGVPGALAEAKLDYDKDAITPDRQVIRSASLEIFSNDPVESAARAEQLAQSLGGFVVSSTVSGSARDEQSANLELRVPEERMNEARQQLRGLGTRIERESTSARDVTRDYVDQQAELRNLHAEEQQYLAILKRAAQVKDVTAVTEKLSEVRGDIGRLEAESRYLGEHVQMAQLTLQVLPEVKAAAGLNWHPLNAARRALRSALDGLSDWVDGMVAILLHIPIVLLWMLTLTLLAKAAWEILRFIGRRFFRISQLAPKPQAS